MVCRAEVSAGGARVSVDPASGGAYREVVAEEMIPVFRVSDAADTADWYRRLGFEIVGEHRFAPDLPVYMFLDRNGVHLHLSEHVGDARPGTLVYFWVEDLDTIAAEFDAEITTQPWAREITLTDPDGNRLRIASLPDPQ